MAPSSGVCPGHAPAAGQRRQASQAKPRPTRWRHVVSGMVNAAWRDLGKRRDRRRSQPSLGATPAITRKQRANARVLRALENGAISIIDAATKPRAVAPQTPNHKDCRPHARQADPATGLSRQRAAAACRAPAHHCQQHRQCRHAGLCGARLQVADAMRAVDEDRSPGTLTRQQHDARHIPLCRPRRGSGDRGWLCRADPAQPGQQQRGHG